MTQSPFPAQPHLRSYSLEEIAYAKWALETGEPDGEGGLNIRTHERVSFVATPDMVAKYRAIVAQGVEPFTEGGA